MLTTKELVVVFGQIKEKKLKMVRVENYLFLRDQCVSLVAPKIA